MQKVTVAEEYKKNKELTKEDIRRVEEWLEKQPHLPKMEELEIILFLHSCSYSVEFTKTTIDTYFTMKTHAPEFFTNRSPDLPSVKQLLNVGLYVTLPKPTPEGYRVLFAKLMDSDPDNYIFSDACKGFDMSTMLHLIQEGTDNGQIILFDMKGLTFGHVTKLGIVTMKKMLYYLQDALPVRLKGLHFINVVPFMDKIMALMRPFMRKELLSVFHLHTNGMESLYNFVPQECLPKDYGGTAASLTELHEQVKKNINENANYFVEDEKRNADESRRPGRPKVSGEIFGVDGTFRKLELD
ncbi:alpha-tocopherol transfer protein-like [Agrilus planipennis]|uniref:Alpha-tocopherol transfer protein-like n=1 Tax=Agrilus planipennis TaxID=224129 RepID=A0A1W4X5F9_AGRPL|nr:alpha-tocopherol transfer protein-like [Agrilus planipennis]